MNIEAHPERAIDLALAGNLPAREQGDLDRHLAACLACSAHMAMARAARTICEPQPFDSGLNRLAVGHALASMQRRRWPLPHFVRRRRGAVLAAGILLALGGVSSAAWWQHVKQSREDAAADAEAQAFRGFARDPGRGTAPIASITAPPAAEILVPEPAADPHGPAPQSGRSQPNAAALFDEASALRSHNKTDQAIAVFRKLQRLYPRARETRLSFALAGHLLLDRGHPAQALAQFDQHLALSGEAMEEALAGRATALGRLGRGDAERDTWKRLLDAYPRTVYGNQARARLILLQGSGNGGRASARPPE